MTPQETQNRIIELENRLDTQATLIAEQQESVKKTEALELRMNTHTHNGVDFSSKLTDRRKQFTFETSYSSTTTVTHQLDFKPRIVFGYGFLLDNVTSPNVIVTSNGVAGRDNLSHSCNNMSLTQDGSQNILYGLGSFDDKLITAKTSDATHVVVSDWTDDSVTLTITIATNWQLGLAIMVTD